MSTFIACILPRMPRKNGGFKTFKSLHKQGKTFICEKCGKECDIKQFTVEHKIPRIIIRASYNKITVGHDDLACYCYKCNHNGSKILTHVGNIFCNRNLEVVKRSSRILCNMVRPEKKYND